jgi:hypothetical protein
MGECTLLGDVYGDSGDLLVGQIFVAGQPDSIPTDRLCRGGAPV